MEKLSKPGENHKVLEPMVGKWKTTTKFWMSPDAPPQESTGTSDNQWIMDGRFVQQDVKGTAMGKPFEGRGLIGYDNVRESYSSVWIDNIGTGIMTSQSKYNPETKTIEESGTYACPMTGKKDQKYRATLNLAEPEKMIYTMFMTDPSGKEFKGMEITYTK